MYNRRPSVHFNAPIWRWDTSWFGVLVTFRVLLCIRTNEMSCSVLASKCTSVRTNNFDTVDFILSTFCHMVAAGIYLYYHGQGAHLSGAYIIIAQYSQVSFIPFSQAENSCHLPISYNVDSYNCRNLSLKPYSHKMVVPPHTVLIILHSKAS